MENISNNRVATKRQMIRVATDAKRQERRKESIMTINYVKGTIGLTKSEMNEAKKFGSEMYTQVMAARRDNPGYRVVEIKAKKTKSDFSNLNMKTIKAYVEKHGTDEQKAHFYFISKRSIGEDGEYCEAQPFFQIKQWFLNDFPEIKQGRKDYREKVQAIYDAAAEKAAA